MRRRSGWAAGLPERARRNRGGSVVELLVALLVGLLVVNLALETLARVRAAQVRMAARTDALVSLRVGRFLLRSELRFGRPGRDWTVAGDSLPIRAFRGTALVCPERPAADELLVWYRGLRGADPAKDSVLLIGPGGTADVRALVGVGAAPGACDAAGGAPVERWRLDAAPSGGVVLARLFERGSYHLSDAALRYDRGDSGRQPLTPEVWALPATAWLTGPDRLAVRLVPNDARAGEAWSGFLAWTAGS